MDKYRPASRLPLVIILVTAVVVIIVVGVVTWKVTKDAYDRPLTSTSGNEGTQAPNSSTGPSATQQPSYTQEEILAKPWLSLRMLRHVLPVHYNISIYPDFYGDHGVFYGNETIELQVLHPTRYILIHAHPTYLNITHWSLLDNKTGVAIHITRTFYYEPNQFFVMETSRIVETSAILKLGFQGNLTKAIVGIYKSTYYNTLTKQQRHLVTSKFEPTYARQAFPCFDEPNIKAEYTIALTHRPDYIALSNMPPEPNQPTPHPRTPGLWVTKFQRSVKMSTYLVCFIVCDFLYTETFSRRNISVRVYATPDKINQTHYALGIANHTLDYYEDLFNMSYPLPKQDLIAIPDFASGAMEHWGLITFRESRLLYNPNQTSLSSLETVASVVAHEMAHQWFGNIVTMDWWNDLWLNEGFASFMEYIGVADKERDWDMENKILVDDLFPVMREDSELSSHPIVVDVQNPSQITSAFDAISYLKGSSIIRMLKFIMGSDNFFTGVSTYLKQFEWGNARTDDLWAALSKTQQSLDIKHIMDTWTIQDGFPYVNISFMTSAEGVTTVTAQQKRFMSNPNAVLDLASSPLGYKWYISLDYLSSNGITGKEVLDMNNTEFSKSIGLSEANSWIKFNHGQHGFYRVLYPDSTWGSFSYHLMNELPQNWRLPVADRAGLLNDAFALAAAGLTSYEIPLAMMAYMAREQEYVPWAAALGGDGGVSYITDMLKTDPDFGLWRRFVARRVRPALEKLGFADVGLHKERNLRAILLSVACAVGEESAVGSVQESFSSWLTNNVSVSVNLRRTVYRFGMLYNGTEENWDQIWAQYQVEPSPQEKELLVFSLASTRHPHLISRLLDFAKREDGIRRQDFFTVVQNVGSNLAADGMLWDWARENYDAFVARFTVSDRNFGRMIYLMVRNYKTQLKLKEVKDFLASYPDEGASARYRRMAVESIQRNIYWMKTYKPVIVNWLKSNI